MIVSVLGTLALVAVALLLGATWYEAVVMAPNYEREVPASIRLARQFLRRTTPAHYFRVVAPVAQLLTLVTLVASWNRPGRWAFLVAFGALIIADVITYTFHYPRLAVMFRSAEDEAPARLARAAHQWAVGNWVRGTLLAVVLLALLHGLRQSTP
jgi:hypothetical protein